jgi:hypothetical protein
MFQSAGYIDLDEECDRIDMIICRYMRVQARRWGS